METKQAFLDDFNAQLQEQYKATSYAVWMAETTGDEEWANKFAEEETKFKLLLSSKEKYDKAKQFLAAGDGSEMEKRQLELLVNEMKSNQLPEEVIADLAKRGADLNLRFNTYSPEVDGKKYSANDIREVLLTSEDQELRKKVWFASKEVGNAVEKNLLALVKKRNEAAQLLGYANHYEMGFALQELDREEVFAMFEELVAQSDDAYRKLKGELDGRLATKFGIAPEDIRPWHYADPFFQEAPPIGATNLDALYKGKDILKLTTDTFESMGIQIDDLYEKSDLFPREKKNPTAFCMDIDRSGDVRVLCSLIEDTYWMETNLHEFGHAAYFKYMDKSLPFTLRVPGHILTTEAIAMMYGKMGKDPRWLTRFLEMDPSTVDELAPELEKFLQLQMLMSVRWIVTFVFFEKELYENPDQDLNALWWKIVQKIQLVTPPDETNNPDWAAKIHFSLAPVYYQNYLLGELLAAQLQRHIETKISPDFFTPEAGEMLINDFFKPAALYDWNEKIERITGEKLNPKHFVEMYCTK